MSLYKIDISIIFFLCFFSNSSHIYKSRRELMPCFSPTILYYWNLSTLTIYFLSFISSIFPNTSVYGRQIYFRSISHKLIFQILPHSLPRPNTCQFFSSYNPPLSCKTALFFMARNTHQRFARESWKRKICWSFLFVVILYSNVVKDY